MGRATKKVTVVDEKDCKVVVQVLDYPTKDVIIDVIQRRRCTVIDLRGVEGKHKKAVKEWWEESNLFTDWEPIAVYQGPDSMTNGDTRTIRTRIVQMNVVLRTSKTITSIVEEKELLDYCKVLEELLEGYLPTEHN